MNNRSDEFAADAITGWSPGLADLHDPKPLHIEPTFLSRAVAPLISLAVLIAALVSLRQLNVGSIVALVPRRADFWVLFGLAYLAAPVADWVIFRRLWCIPLSGLAPLVRKLIGNEILLGYVGEVYFYAWARRRADITAAPFGAIKDVAVLSALVGNAVTLVMLAVAAPLYGKLGQATGSELLMWSIVTVLASSVGALILRRRLFTMPRRELYFIAAVHLARIVATTGITALLWHLVLPSVALSWWLLLATLRMLLSRLPLVPNKDIVFASIAVLLVGHDLEIGALMAMIASLLLATHVLLGMAMMTGDLIRTGSRS